ncbi:hypothetical protein ACH4YO_33825 [Streptomyces noursei]|uniref:hypothetical protein n=1 Tax=Streptomyces noursei TaxID=1971 RepID=UPI0037979B91
MAYVRRSSACLEEKLAQIRSDDGIVEQNSDQTPIAPAVDGSRERLLLVLTHSRAATRAVCDPRFRAEPAFWMDQHLGMVTRTRLRTLGQ